MVVIAPLVAAAGIQAAGGAFEGFFGRQAKNNQIAGDWALQNYLGQQNAANNIMGLNASLGSNLSSNRYSNVVGPDLDRLRQREAKFDMSNIFLPKEEALKRILEVDPYKTPSMNDIEEHELEGFLTYNMGDQ